MARNAGARRLATTAVFLLAAALPAAAERIYWTEFDAGSLRRADLERSELAELATGLQYPFGVAVDLDGRRVYWANPGSSDIRRMSFKGSHLSSVVTTAKVPFLQPLGVAIDPMAGKLYWTNQHGGKIQRSDLNGLDVETLLTGLPYPTAIAVDPQGQKIYWTDRLALKVQRADLDGSNVEDLFTGVDSAGIVVDSDTGTIYWTENAPGSQGKIRRANTDGSAAQEILVDLMAPTAIALDSERGRIYWMDDLQGLRRVNLNGTEVESVLPTLASFGLAIDPTSPPTGPGTVFTHGKISRTEGSWYGDPVYQFGDAVAGIGDLDGDGIDDLAVGDRLGWESGGDAGAVWILLLNEDGSVRSHRKNIEGSYEPGRRLGRALATIGDLDGDGTNELAVGLKDTIVNCEDCEGDGLPGDEDCCVLEHIGVWIVFLNQDGTFATKEVIVGGGHEFGLALAPVGDLDGDGVADLAVGDPGDGDGGIDTGAVWILFLNADGTVKTRQKISANEGDFEGWLTLGGRFGDTLTWIGDDDEEDDGWLAVGAPGGSEIWLLSLESDGTVDSHLTIGETGAPFDDALGWRMTSPGDLDGDDLADLVLGAPFDSEDGLSSSGAVWLLFLDDDGAVKSFQKISELQGGFEGALDSHDRFGSAVASLGDLDGDGIGELVVGAPGDDDGGTGSGQFAGPGAVWVLFLNGVTDGDDEDENDDEDGFGDSMDGGPRTDYTVDGLRDVMADDDLDDDSPRSNRRSRR